MLALRLEVIAGQGYNVALAPSGRLDHPVIMEEAHAVATPFADRIRLGGTVEFAGDAPTFDARRVEAILRCLVARGLVSEAAYVDELRRLLKQR